MSGSLAGAVLGTMGTALGLNGQSPLSVVVACIFLVCALKEARLLWLRLPTFRRPTPRWFADEFGPTWAAFVWGVDLGQGWTTRIEFVGYYGIAAWVFLFGGAVGGVAVMGTYGLARSVPVIVAGFSKYNGHAWAMYGRRAETIRLVDAVALSVAAGYFAAGVGVM